MLRSANDAAQALALGVSGSEAMFAELMNSRTIQLGLNDSHWDNPHGLDTDTHLTSAYDLAMITKEALTIDKFREIIATESFTIDWEGYEYDRVIYNHNQFLDIYEGAIGVKTGYTNKSGSCLIGAAERNGLILIGVVLNAEDHYDAMTQLMDYGFANYESVEMGKKGDVVGSIKVLRSNLDTVDVVLGRDVVLPVEMGSNFEPEVKYNFPLTLDAPFNTEEPIGTAVYVDSMGYSAEIPLYASKNAELYTFKLVFSQIWQRFISWLM